MRDFPQNFVERDSKRAAEFERRLQRIQRDVAGAAVEECKRRSGAPHDSGTATRTTGRSGEAVPDGSPFCSVSGSPTR